MEDSERRRKNENENEIEIQPDIKGAIGVGDFENFLNFGRVPAFKKTRKKKRK